MTFGAMHGIARYTAGLTRALRQVAPQDELILLTPPDTGEAPWFDGLDVGRIATEVPFVSIREQWALRPVLKSVAPDLFHAPSFALPRFCPVPIVASVHDMIHVQFADDYTTKHQLYYDWILGPALRLMPRVLTDSAYSAKSIVEYFRVLPEKVIVTPLGIEPRWRPVEDAARIAEVRERFGLPEEYILFMGNPKPHKNAHGAIEAFAKSGLACTLALRIGVVDELETLAEKLGVADRVMFIDRADDQDLMALYSGARLMVFPSFCEGFGLPVLEAMACGCPVVTSNVSSLPEVAGDACEMVDPADTDALAAALKRVATDDALRADRARRGIAHAATFRWEDTARRTREVYGEVVALSQQPY